MAWTRQLVPFQASARFTPRRGVLPMAAPTAVQAVADAQDTPVKVLLAAPLGRMVCWIRQLVPFHRSAKVNPGLDRLAAWEPTAVQARPEVHETAENSLISALARFGVGSTFHALPAAVRGWLACAAPAVTIPGKPSTKATAPSSPTARVQHTPARGPLLLPRLTRPVRCDSAIASTLHSARRQSRAAALTSQRQANMPSGRRTPLRWQLSAPDRPRTRAACARPGPGGARAAAARTPGGSRTW